MSTFISPGWLRWGIALAILASCALFLDLRESFQILQRVPPHSIVFILVLSTLDRLLVAWKGLFLLRGIEVQIAFSTLLRIYYQGSFAGTFLPSSLAGDMLRAHWVARSTGATHQVYASLLMEKLIGFISAMNWALLGGFVVVISLFPQRLFYWIITALIGVVVLNSLLVISLQPSVLRAIQRNLTRVSSSRVLDFINRLCEAYSRYGTRRNMLVWNGILTMIEHSLQMFIIFAMANSLGITVNTMLFFAITAVYLFIYRFPITPDGWGLGEITAIGLFGLIGVSAEGSFALAFLAHVVQTIVVLPGLWFLWSSGPAINMSSRWRSQRNAP